MVLLLGIFICEGSGQQRNKVHEVNRNYTLVNLVLQGVRLYNQMEYVWPTLSLKMREFSICGSNLTVYSSLLLLRFQSHSMEYSVSLIISRVLDGSRSGEGNDCMREHSVKPISKSAHQELLPFFFYTLVGTIKILPQAS